MEHNPSGARIPYLDQGEKESGETETGDEDRM